MVSSENGHEPEETWKYHLTSSCIVDCSLPLCPVGTCVDIMFSVLLRIGLKHPSSALSRHQLERTCPQVVVEQGSLRAYISGGDYRLHAAGSSRRSLNQFGCLSHISSSVVRLKWCSLLPYVVSPRRALAHRFICLTGTRYVYYVRRCSLQQTVGAHRTKTFSGRPVVNIIPGWAPTYRQAIGKAYESSNPSRKKAAQSSSFGLQ